MSSHQGEHPHRPAPPPGSSQKAHRERLERIQEARRQKMAQHLQQLKAQYMTEYLLPLNYPARVEAVGGEDSHGDGDVGDVSGTQQPKQRLQPPSTPVRTKEEFVNARLLEAGLPLGGGLPGWTDTAPSEMTLGHHAGRIARFIRDLEGTGCYDSVQVFLGNEGAGSEKEGDERPSRSKDVPLDVTVRLKEKKWYKLYVGGGVNAEDLSSAGGGDSHPAATAYPFSAMGGGLGGGGLALPKLQFETSASLLNLTGFADVTSALYTVDQTGTSSFQFTHDRPLCSCLPRTSLLRSWILPPDPRAIDPSERHSTAHDDDERDLYADDDFQYALGGGSHTHLGFHAALRDHDHESTRSSREFVRSIGMRLANHSRGTHRSPVGGMGGFQPSSTPPERMAGPYLFLDWNACLRDALPKRHARFPFGLDCSKEVASEAGTCLKHSFVGGVFLNGCWTDDRYDPTMGYDAHLSGEVATPPGDVGFWKLKGGGAWHVPWELVRLMALGVGEGEYEKMKMEETGVEGTKEEDEDPVVIGMTLHSSFHFGLVRPLTFGGLCSGKIPLADRFYVGGPGQLRGFMPAGIGPRASRGGSSVPGGDSLGGDLFYTSTLATSVPFPKSLSTLRHNGARLFGFVNAGTCVSTTGGASGTVSLLGMPAWNQILKSSRVAVGGGVSVGSPMGRFEATYAVPLRYGPRDARKAVQLGFGFSFG